METKVAVLSIIVANKENVEKVNALLNAYGDYIIGRMGIPHKEKGINIICIAMDAPQDEISALSGKVGNLDGITSKVTYSA